MGSLFDVQILIFFLAFARIMAMLEVSPVITGAGIPFAARAGLSFFTTSVITPVLVAQGYLIISSTQMFIYFLIVEILIGLIFGFFISIVFAVMGSVGQLFSLQMGFGATETFDPLAQVELPVTAQLLNLAAFLVFFSSFGMQKLFLSGVEASFHTLNATQIYWNIDGLTQFFLKAVVALFGQSLMIAMPLMGTMFLISISMGLLNKAAPQMNLMMLGYPVQIVLGYFILILALPMMLNIFDSLLTQAWQDFGTLIKLLKG
jgi:flagellar biosynthetic protein FliR